MFDDQIFHKLLILRTPGIGPIKYAELIRKFGSVIVAAESLRFDTTHVDSVRREMDAANNLGIRYVCDDSPDYPENLKTIRGAPPIITVRGNVSALRKRSVAIVGTRHATGAGLRFAHDLAHAFAKNNYAVISGMAMGTDTAAHRGALMATDNDAVTVAVLAGGVDYIWPLENERLYFEILERGCIVSEMPVGMTPVTNNFIQRNRWVAGLSEKLILGEADAKSGSIATAGNMLEYGRPVYAIPSHPSDPRSTGPNRLIKEGSAILCLGEDDFFDNGKKISIQKTRKSSQENDVLDKLGNIPMTESVLAELVKKDIGEIKRDLVVLELDGIVKKTDGGYVKI